MTHKPIALSFWVEIGVNCLCGWAQVDIFTPHVILVKRNTLPL